MIYALIHNIILFSILVLISVYLLTFSVKYKNQNKYGFNSTIITAVLLIILGLTIIIFDLIPYPLNAAINIWLLIIFSLQLVYYLIIRFKFKEGANKTNIEDDTYEDGEIKIQSEYLRKSFHTVILLVAFCYFFVAFMINDFVYEIYLADPELYYSIWKTNQYPLNPAHSSNIQVTLSWTFMFFISAIMLLIIPDIFRIYNRKYSMFSGVYKKVIRMKEFYTVGPQIYLTLACTIVFLMVLLGIFEPSVAIAGMFIAAFGDAAAAIIGRRYGKHKFTTVIQKEQLKSYEGLIAGFIVSYISALIFVGPIFALLGAITFSFIDYLNPNIADNILNPIMCTIAMMIPFWIIA